VFIDPIHIDPLNFGWKVMSPEEHKKRKDDDKIGGLSKIDLEEEEDEENEDK